MPLPLPKNFQWDILEIKIINRIRVPTQEAVTPKLAAETVAVTFVPRCQEHRRLQGTKGSTQAPKSQESLLTRSCLFSSPCQANFCFLGSSRCPRVEVCLYSSSRPTWQTGSSHPPSRHSYQTAAAQGVGAATPCSARRGAVWVPRHIQADSVQASHPDAPSRPEPFRPHVPRP